MHAIDSDIPKLAILSSKRSGFALCGRADVCHMVTTCACSHFGTALFAGAALGHL